MIITGNEKAILGGLASGVATLLVQLSANNHLTLREALYAVAAFIATHLVIYTTTNTPTQPTNQGVPNVPIA
jgi:hypothetical protein